MAVRSMEELRRDQAALLGTYRDRLDAAGAGGAASTTPPRAALQWGRVTQVVSSDEDHGPHLMIQGYVYTGSPPALTQSVAAPMRCYPAPGKTVGDYAVDDYVHLTPTAGAVIAERLT